jgi:hypothetical protein
MAQDLADYRALRDDSDEPQCPALAQRTGGPFQGKHALLELGAAPARRSRIGLLLIYTLLTWGREDHPTQAAVRCEAAPIPHQVNLGQRHECCQFLQEFQR